MPAKTPDSPITVIDDLVESSPMPATGMGHRTVFTSPEARIVVLSFAKGHVLREHSAPFPLLMQALDGEFAVTSAGQLIQLVPGGLIRMEAKLAHSVEAIEDSRLMLTLLTA
jgi:quercetin dioxygenase-like cupin family protein